MNTLNISGVVITIRAEGNGVVLHVTLDDEVHMSAAEANLIIAALIVAIEETKKGEP
jgi:hypothetical protein